MVRSFWRMVPVSASASELGLNVKTLQKYHGRLRRMISEAGERTALGQLGAITAPAGHFYRSARERKLGAGVLPLFCLVLNGDKVLLLALEEAEGSLANLGIPGTAGWIYAHDQNAKDCLDLDRIHFLSVGNAKELRDQVGFWINAKRRLVKYRGGFRKNFQLFMREMEFRFNNDNEDLTCDFLLDYLQNDTTNRDRR